MSWTAPDANSGAAITSYTVQWKSVTQVQDYLASRQATAAADATSYTIENLVNGDGVHGAGAGHQPHR